MIHQNLIRLPTNVWYNIPDDRPDKAELLNCIDNQIVLFGNFQFNDDRSKFRKVPTQIELKRDWEEFIKEIDDLNKISYTISYAKEQDAIFNYEYLEAKVKPIDKKNWDKLKGRAI